MLAQQFHPLLLALDGSAIRAQLQRRAAGQHPGAAPVAHPQGIDRLLRGPDSTLLCSGLTSDGAQCGPLILDGCQGLAQLQLAVGAGSSCHGSTLPRSGRFEKINQVGGFLSHSKLSDLGGLRTLTRVLAWVVQPLLQSSPALTNQQLGSRFGCLLFGLGDVGAE